MPISAADPLPGVRPVPTRWSAFVFAGKVAVLRLWRGIRNVAAGGGPAAAPSASRCRRGPGRVALAALVRYATGGSPPSGGQGAAPAAGSTFSFWRQLGQDSRARGFAAGQMLQQGCVVPAIGGGLCQLSNALYDVALQAGCEIVERHVHSRRVPGSAAMQGRDATVAWNYVDLRFRPAQAALHLSVRLTADELVVGLHGAVRAAHGAPGPALPGAPDLDDRPQAQSCDACAQTGCFRHGRAPEGGAGQQAILVDEA